MLATLMAFGSISTDLYLPAMPTMARDLHAGTGILEFTISGYLIGFSRGSSGGARSATAWVPKTLVADRDRPVRDRLGGLRAVADRHGDHRLAGNPGGRRLRGRGAVPSHGAGPVRARPGGADALPPSSSWRWPRSVGPLLGGQILSVASWHWIFWLLVAIGGVALAALFTVPETLTPERRDPDAVRHAFSRYAGLLADRRVLAYAGISGSFYVGAFAFIAGTPFAYISYYHVPPTLYGLLFGASILGIMLVNMANARLVGRFGSDRLLRVGAVVAAVAGLASAAAGWTGFGGLAGLAVPIVIFSAVNGLIVANSLAGALAAWPDRAGAVSALGRFIAWQRHPRLGLGRPRRGRHALAPRRGDGAVRSSTPPRQHAASQGSDGARTRHNSNWMLQHGPHNDDDGRTAAGTPDLGGHPPRTGRIGSVAEPRPREDVGVHDRLLLGEPRPSTDRPRAAGAKKSKLEYTIVSDVGAPAMNQVPVRIVLSRVSRRRTRRGFCGRQP
ncbi:MFS transporter [Sphingomonas sp. MMS24-JH45]